MKKRKIIALLLLTAVVGGLLVACKKEVPPDAAPGTELSERWKKEIKTAWTATYLKNDIFVWFGEGKYDEDIERFHSARHYGTYNGYVVVFIPPFPPESFPGPLGPETIAGYAFNFGCPFQLVVYRNGRFTDLKEAYEAGKLTKENIAEIYEYHKNTFPIYYS